MKSFILASIVILLLSFYILLPAQCFDEPTSFWEKNYGGSGTEFGFVVIETSDGGFALLGGSDSFDNFVSGNNGDSDVWLVRTNASGNILWEQNYGGPGFDYGTSIIEISDGFLICGSILGVAGGDQTGGDVTGNYGAYDVWLVRTDTNGNLLWEQNYGGTGSDGGFSMIETSGGGYAVLGRSHIATDDVTENNGYIDSWLMRIDTNGNLLWEQSYGGTGLDMGLELIETSDGGFALLGRSESSDGDVMSNNGESDVWLVRTDANGDMLWQQNYGGSENDYGNGIIETSDGGFALLGYSDSSDGDVGSNNGESDVWLVRTDVNGNILWEQNYGGSGIDLGYSFIVTSDEGFVLLGFSDSSDGDVGNNNGGFDVWLVRTDAMGNILWEQNYGGSAAELGGSIIETSDGNFAMVVSCASSNGDVTGNNGASDYWLVVLNCPKPIVEVLVMLEGAFNEVNNEMKTSLIENGLLLDENDILITDENAVDWVTVSILDDNCEIIASKEILLMKDGSVSGIFEGLVLGEYYIEVNHRNHLKITSNVSVLLPNEGNPYDFITDSSSANGTAQLVELEEGIYGMYAGDADDNSVINVSDFNSWATNPAAVNVYESYDYDCNGIINVSDFNLWFKNRSKIGFLCE